MVNPFRCGLTAVTLLVLFTAPLAGQARRPVVGLTGGLGNVLGGLGAGVEYYLADGRVSGGAGLGYWPSDLCQGTLSGAAAVRGFIGGRHRGFLEASYSLLAISCPFVGDDMDRHYGPGFSGGYRYIGSDGFTFTGGVGIGDVPGEFGTEVIVLLGLGYTWQR